MKKWMGWALVLVLSLGLMVTGCSDDDDPADPGPPDDEQTLYPDPDQLMQGFVSIYNDMDQSEFRWLVHEDARFLILPSTLDEWENGSGPLANDHFDHQALLAIHGNIFSGEAGLDATGVLVPPVDSIQVNYITRQGMWEPIPEADPVFGDIQGYWGLFNVHMYFNNPDQHRFQLEGHVEFYVTEVAIEGATGWQIIGWREIDAFVAKQGTETTNWCQILSLYR